ncbi:MAG: serine protease [Verrucomicrobiota bacterium]
MNHPALRRRSFAIGGLVCCLVSLKLSAAPELKVESAPGLSNYTKVYLPPPQNDTHKVNPRLLARLRQAGFDAVEVKPGSLPFTSQGSGFVVTSEGQVLTCAHVVGKETQATLVIEGVRRMGRVLVADTNLDVAIIQVESPHPTFRSLPLAADGDQKLGEDIVAMGFPMADVLGTSPRLTKGSITATAGIGDDVSHVQISAAIQPGNSGGPLLNQHGEVVGLVDTTLEPMNFLLRTGGELPQNVNFALKGRRLREFLNRSKVVFTEGTNTVAADFDTTSKSLVLIRAGVVDESRLHERALFCHCVYLAAGNRGFPVFRLDLIDLRQFRRVFRADHLKNDYASENAVLDAVFGEISARFFPDRPNPWRSKVKK